MRALSKEYANSSGSSMVIDIKLLERRDLKGWLKRVKISTVFVQGVIFLTRLPSFGFGNSDFEFEQKIQIFLVGFMRGGPGGFGV
jgi:hypothetical protein